MARPNKEGQFLQIDSSGETEMETAVNKEPFLRPMCSSGLELFLKEQLYHPMLQGGTHGGYIPYTSTRQVISIKFTQILSCLSTQVFCISEVIRKLETGNLSEGFTNTELQPHEEILALVIASETLSTTNCALPLGPILTTANFFVVCFASPLISEFLLQSSEFPLKLQEIAGPSLTTRWW